MSSATRSPGGDRYLAGSADSKSRDLSPGCHGETRWRGQRRDRSGSLPNPPFPRYCPAPSAGRYPRLCAIVPVITRLRGTRHGLRPCADHLGSRRCRRRCGPDEGGATPRRRRADDADGPRRTDRAEGAVQVLIMLAIGGAAGAASFTHVHNVAAAHGQPGWLAWADAIVLELMSIASGLELRRRKRAHTSHQVPGRRARLRGRTVARRAGRRGRTLADRLDRRSRTGARLPRHGQGRPRLHRHGDPDRRHPVRTTAEPDHEHQPTSPERRQGHGPPDRWGNGLTTRTGRPSGARHRRDGRTRRRSTTIASGPRTARRTRTSCCRRHDTSGTGSPRTGRYSPGQRSPRLSAPPATPSPTPAYPTSSRSSKPSCRPATGSKNGQTSPAAMPNHATDTTDRPDTDDNHRPHEPETSHHDQEHFDHEYPRESN